jgi:hypothetical protein
MIIEKNMVCKKGDRPACVRIVTQAEGRHFLWSHLDKNTYIH